MGWQAKYKYARISARKVRLIADMVRGRGVQDALNILRFTPNRAAGMISKTITSAVASASEAEADAERLVINEIRVDEGPVMKRFIEKDRGRAHPILKRSSHIVVVVDEQG